MPYLFRHKKARTGTDEINVNIDLHATYNGRWIENEKIPIEMNNFYDFFAQ